MKAKELKEAPAIREAPKVFWFFGPPQTGKTETAVNIDPDAYIYSYSNDKM